MRKLVTMFLTSLVIAVFVSLSGLQVKASEATQTEEQSTAEEKTDYTVSTNNPEADAVFNAYIEKASQMVGDSRFDDVFHLYEVLEKDMADRYEKYAGRPREEWLDYTTFERFLLYETYVKPAMCKASSDYDYYYSTLDNFRIHIADKYDVIARVDQEQADAFMELMDWVYEYIMENGSPYNYMTGNSASEENSELESIAAANIAAKEEADAKDREFLSGIQEEYNVTIQTEPNEEGTSPVVWVVVVIAVIAIAAGAFILGTKKK